MDPAGWLTALLGAAALHAGFQLTVTLVVYPALADLPPDGWGPAHDAHSRRITPVVGVVYLAALVACGGALLQAPSPGVLVAVAGTLAAVAVTAVSAAPTHGRLGRGREDALVRRLLRADRLRCAAALVALAGAVAALV
jgi:hypothetical protein